MNVNSFVVVKGVEAVASEKVVTVIILHAGSSVFVGETTKYLAILVLGASILLAVKA